MSSWLFFLIRTMLLNLYNRIADVSHSFDKKLIPVPVMRLGEQRKNERYISKIRW